MKVKEFADRLNLKIISGGEGLEKEVSGVYVSDLLSWVMSHAEKGNAWITVHTHINTVAIAVLNDLSCIVIPENVEVEKATVEKAKEEKVVILSIEKTAYEICLGAGKIL
ncbi:MAG: DRTGG domain-containing protein [Clostridia bacterium]